ncbi:polar amino acid transport system substrate-binding protein [Pseudomonas cuatrocienegasensis]|uniref:Polar amino acid transport system substrate-binding protein n=1 Tax=Pseudomonas cuatrocienegasensis TaxID=543360 RepID=A0ABY1B7B5_9PSED|nr:MULTISPECIES: transporter substrate-binding domain-containing protein [Pseudomonas]OEC36977.1 amino acid ABC transporter substrate-binding protein [Pseudomonas sp. 21C1]SEQ12959.1 polar amino acid transport system substrate-binding protein [Pseudomonas cuatrocienegasensis]
MSPLFALPLLLVVAWANAETVLRADYRDRPPEMQSVDGTPVGPLIDILNQAARHVGARVEWRHAPFIRSIEDLKSGRIDLVPRVLDTAERHAYIHYLPSIGVQQLSVRFIVPPGQEQRIGDYADLQGLTIGTKRGTAYFEPFDSDGLLSKVVVTDDYLLAGMFRAGRLDVMAVLDAPAIEVQFKALGFDDYRYAAYRHDQSILNYYGASLALYQGERGLLYERLGQELARMRDSGEIAAIYRQHELPSPVPSVP